MIRGLYSSAAGLSAAQATIDVSADNLANSSIPGFRKSRESIKTFHEELVSRIEDDVSIMPGNKNATPIGSITHGAALAEVISVFTQGSLTSTGIVSNMAIEGEGFFQVETPKGIRYTRNGAFSVDMSGNLVSSQGYPVIGVDGMPIKGLPTDGFELKPDGRIKAKGVIIATVSVVDFEPRTLQREGLVLFSAEGLTPIPTEATLFQSFVEDSNVDNAEEMTNLMMIQQTYSANQRVMTTLDTTLQKAVNEIARM